MIEDRNHYFELIKELGVSADTISRIKAFHSSIGLQKVKTEATRMAQQGENDTKIIDDYRGIKVLSAFKPLNIENLEWVVVGKKLMKVKLSRRDFIYCAIPY